MKMTLFSLPAGIQMHFQAINNESAISQYIKMNKSHFKAFKTYTFKAKIRKTLKITKVFIFFQKITFQSFSDHNIDMKSELKVGNSVSRALSFNDNTKLL